jgi:threonylcarbamoyladenosine tRNA methylthiotransferase MtaB
MKIGFYTLGCKLNQAETDEIKEKLLKAGFKIASNPYQAQLVILGACGVTINASQRTRQMIRAFKRKGAKVFVMGCLENKIPEIDFYSQNPQKIFQKIKEEQLLFPQKTTKKSPEKISNFLSKNSFKEKARAFIKIQTGCNFHCTFCLSRQFRGLSQSVDPTKILNQIKEKIKKGS